MSTELLIQKIVVAILLFSAIPGMYWGYNESRYEPWYARLFSAILGGMMPPCLIGCVVVLGLVLLKAILFLFS